jgi:hypothetical protein
LREGFVEFGDYGKFYILILDFFFFMEEPTELDFRRIGALEGQYLVIVDELWNVGPGGYLGDFLRVYKVVEGKFQKVDGVKDYVSGGRIADALKANIELITGLGTVHTPLRRNRHDDFLPLSNYGDEFQTLARGLEQEHIGYLLTQGVAVGTFSHGHSESERRVVDADVMGPISVYQVMMEN